MRPVLSLFRRKPARPSPPPRVTVDETRAMGATEWRALLAGPLEAALPRIEAAARDGVVEAMLTLGQALLDRGDQEGAAAWFGAAAAAGDAMGINMLGRCHELGWGMPADPARAAALYERASDMGLDWAHFNLGMLALRGGEATRAGRLFARAAAQGHAKAMNMLGMLAEREERRPEALGWYRAAAEGGDFRGQFNLGTVLAQSGDGDGAWVWFRRALDSRNPDVMAGVARLLDRHAHAGLRALAEEARGRPTGAACC